MKQYILYFAFLAVLAVPTLSQATTVQFQVDPSRFGTYTMANGDTDFFSSDLNGLKLEGQRVSWDLVFNEGVIARLHGATYDWIGIGLSVYTDAPHDLMAAIPRASGYLLDRDGQPLGEHQTFGGGGSDGGELGIGGPFAGGAFGNALPYLTDIRGIHIDTTLPGTGYTVTNARLRFSTYLPAVGVTIGHLAPVPEPSTVLLLVLALGGFLAWRRAPWWN